MNTGFKKIARFFESERSRLIAFVRRRLDDAAGLDSEDIVQEVALNLFSMADVSAPIENLSAYVYQALRNRIIDAIRRRKNVVSLDRDMPGESSRTLKDLLPDSRTCLETEMERRQLISCIEKAMRSLGDRERAVIIETEFHDRSFKDLAVAWDVPLGTLLSQKSRALDKIKKHLRENHIL